MRIFLLSLTFLAFSPVLRAAGPVTPKTTEVTVYRAGAKISSQATVKVPAGSSEVVFENLSPYFNGNSLQVRIKGDARLNSAVFQMRNPGPAPENPRAQIIRDSLILLGDSGTRINDERDVLNEEAELIRKNQFRVSTTTGEGARSTLTVEELRALATYYRQRLLEIKNRLLDIEIARRILAKQQQELNTELARLHPNTANRTGEIVLKLDANAAQSLEITCTYLVNNAAWEPLYDLRAAGLDQPLQLVYKANVGNNTGFDWTGVMLHLSSAQPLANNDRPILNPVFVDFRPIAVYQERAKGMEQEQVNAYQMAQLNIRADDAAILSEVVVNAAGAAETGGPDLIASFDLPNPQDIPSDGKEHIFTIDEKEMLAEYEYHAVPKVEPAVFLLAKVTDYGQYNLLPGTANIFFEDTYIGQTWVNPGTISDTLLLSLGRDEQISIKRVQPRDFKERRKIFGSKIRETYVFEIAIKNNKSVPVAIDIIDQVPVSRQKDIEVNLEDKGGASYTPDFGKLQWKLEVPAGKNQKIRFSYSVEYPKDKRIGNFRG